MVALQISSMKQFMNHLLVADTFDRFDLEEAVISTANTFHIDGHINPEFYEDESVGIADTPSNVVPAVLPEFRPWSELKSIAFDLIKGKRTPLFFRFTLHLSGAETNALLEREHCDVPAAQVKALVLNIRYDGATAVLTTATAYHTFLMSKEPDTIWDKYLQDYLSEKGIEYTIL